MDFLKRRRPPLFPHQIEIGGTDTHWAPSSESDTEEDVAASNTFSQQQRRKRGDSVTQITPNRFTTDEMGLNWSNNSSHKSGLQNSRSSGSSNRSSSSLADYDQRFQDQEQRRAQMRQRARLGEFCQDFGVENIGNVYEYYTKKNYQTPSTFAGSGSVADFMYLLKPIKRVANAKRREMMLGGSQSSTGAATSLQKLLIKGITLNHLLSMSSRSTSQQTRNVLLQQILREFHIPRLVREYIRKQRSRGKSSRGSKAAAAAPSLPNGHGRATAAAVYHPLIAPTQSDLDYLEKHMVINYHLYAGIAEKGLGNKKGKGNPTTLPPTVLFLEMRLVRGENLANFLNPPVTFDDSVFAAPVSFQAQQQYCQDATTTSSLPKHDPKELMDLCEEVLRIVSTLNYLQVVHGDVKPDNFILKPLKKASYSSSLSSSSHHDLILIDFGFACLVTPGPSSSRKGGKGKGSSYSSCFSSEDEGPWTSGSFSSSSVPISMLLCNSIKSTGSKNLMAPALYGGPKKVAITVTDKNLFLKELFAVVKTCYMILFGENEDGHGDIHQRDPRMEKLFVLFKCVGLLLPMTNPRKRTTNSSVVMISFEKMLKNLYQAKIIPREGHLLCYHHILWHCYQYVAAARS